MVGAFKIHSRNPTGGRNHPQHRPGPEIIRGGNAAKRRVTAFEPAKLPSGNSTKDVRGSGCWRLVHAQLSALPNPCRLGIFRPEGGGRDSSVESPGDCQSGKVGRARGHRGEAGNCLADEFILETHGLTKEFAGFFAVRDVALKVRRGAFMR